MKFSTLALWATAALAAPLEKRVTITDADILQYALTLEHLENVFYKGALERFSEWQFIEAGFSSAYYNNLRYIAFDEQSHVELLTSALTTAGAKPVAACSYKFPYSDPRGFVGLASVLEGVGTSAYLGGAPLITSKAYLAVAGSILVTEALHTSLQRFSLGEIGPGNPYGTALGLNEVYTLAAAFITNCPTTNAVLPVKAFPTLTADFSGIIRVGQVAVFQIPTGYKSGSASYVTFVSGLTVVSVPAFISGGCIGAQVPTTVSGQTYALITSSNVTVLADSVVLAGPAVIEVDPQTPVIDFNEQ